MVMHGSKCWLWLLLSQLAVAILLFTEILHASPIPITDHEDERGLKLKTAVFLTPKFELEPGLVSNKFYYDIDFPTGHIAIKSFDAEVVDEARKPVPLHETYLHHWALERYYQREGISNYNIENPRNNRNHGFQKWDYIPAGNSGVCKRSLPQYYGLGSETRRTSTHVPDPYGIVVGNPSEIPEGYQEKWLLNVHAIETRGAEDWLGCTECRCDLYNVTKDEDGRVIEPDYIGGLRCCHDQTRCRILEEGFQNVKRKLYLKYTVKYLDWHPSIVPVKIYIFDVTDTWKNSNIGSTTSGHNCLIEYQVEFCGSAVAKDGDCTDVKRLSVMSPDSGDVIYGVAHQHTGGIGSTLFGEDGRVICSSIPIYGEGNEAGNEAGYIVGMSTCYPKPGTMKISQGEILTLVSNYSSNQQHTGVMGLFYILVANSNASFQQHSQRPVGIHSDYSIRNGGLLVGVAILVVAVIVVVWQRKNHPQRESYEPIMVA